MSTVKKPFLRGHFHQAAFFTALGACALLLVKSRAGLSMMSSLIYSLSLVTLLGVSALYHRVNWGPGKRMLMRRLDHASIFFLIAGTMTPIGLLAMPESSGTKLLVLGWSAAAAGALTSLVFVKKPKWLNSLICVFASIIVVPYLPDMTKGLGNNNVLLIVAGGVAYLIGALAYALKRPRFFPSVFGYHEFFHVMVLVGATTHFMVIQSLV